MNPWWWVPLGLILWFAVAIAVGPFIGQWIKWKRDK